MKRVPAPTAEQMNNALRFSEGNRRKAVALLCDAVDAHHPALRAHIARRLDLHCDAPHDTADFIPISSLPPLM